MVLTPPISPMLARPRDTLPPASQMPDAFWQQKLDGYRALAFIRSGALYLQSRGGANLTPSFPDLAAAARDVHEDLVVDGELVVFAGGRLDFAALQQRARRTRRGAAEAARSTPAHIVAFDLLEADGEAWLTRPYGERWARLEAAFTSGALRPPWTLVSCTREREVAEAWLDPAYGRVGVEGVMIKTGSGLYWPGQRGWWKVRSFQSAEGIVAGVTGPVSGPRSLLLGRYDSAGRLRFVARTTPLSAAARRDVGALLVPGGPEHPWVGVRLSAGWGSQEELRFATVRPELVVEVRTDSAVEQGRHRHPVRFLRVRDDLAPYEVPAL
ncbi:ATP-dependent DNA ligase [Streptomyces sp. NPDC059003]|uniref:ATP-dependent DNA ligase n=1 Tax=Streptomyces sp. NPDC059003 TaxID=3346691 RepID=UPI003690F009